jgi:diacylglycerol O-acyltransferase
MQVMSGLDARFLFSELPSAHMHTMKVAVVDVSARSEPLTPERLLDALEARLDRMPVLRRRVVPVPHGLGNPVLIDDADFELRRHIHHVRAPSPGGTCELGDVVARIAGVSLPRDRPLWDLTVVEGLAGGQVGFVVKIHHALADGAAAVALLTNAFALDGSEAVVEPFHLETLPSKRALYRAAAPNAVRALRSIPALVLQTATGLRHKRTARHRETTPVLGPFAGPRTPFNVSLTPERTFATLTLPIEAMTAAKRAAGASLNDVFLALCGGGVRRYLLRTGDLPGASLVASVPMGTRPDGRRLSGNHVDNLFVPLHTDVAEPNERLRAVHASTSAARRVRTALGTELFERRAELIPPLLHTMTTRSWAATGLADHVRPPLNLVASSVPGPRAPHQLDGGIITALYSSGPILEGIGLNITAWSYVDTLYVSLLGCPSSLPDPWLLADDIAAEMAAL